MKYNVITISYFPDEVWGRLTRLGSQISKSWLNGERCQSVHTNIPSNLLSQLDNAPKLNLEVLPYENLHHLQDSIRSLITTSLYTHQKGEISRINLSWDYQIKSNITVTEHHNTVTIAMGLLASKED